MDLGVLKKVKKWIQGKGGFVALAEGRWVHEAARDSAVGLLVADLIVHSFVGGRAAALHGQPHHGEVLAGPASWRLSPQRQQLTAPCKAAAARVAASCSMLVARGMRACFGVFAAGSREACPCPRADRWLAGWGLVCRGSSRRAVLRLTAGCRVTSCGDRGVGGE